MDTYSQVGVNPDNDLLTGIRFPLTALTHVDGTLSPWLGAGLGAGDREDLPQAPKELRSGVRGQGQCWDMATGTEGQGHGVPRKSRGAGEGFFHNGMGWGKSGNVSLRKHHLNWL